MVIIILMAAAAGLTRGYDILKIFGIGTMAGVAGAGLAGRGSMLGKTAFSKAPTKALGSGRRFAGAAGSLTSKGGKSLGQQAGGKLNARTQAKLERQHTDALTNLIDKRLAGKTQEAKEVGRLNKTRTGLGVFMRMATPVAGVGIGHAMGGKGSQISHNAAYERALKRYREAETEDKGKYASQLLGLVSKSKIAFGSELEFAATADATKYELGKAAAKRAEIVADAAKKGRGVNDLTRGEGKRINQIGEELRAKLTDFAKIEALGKELEKQTQQAGVSIGMAALAAGGAAGASEETMGRARDRVSKLVHAFYEPKNGMIGGTNVNAMVEERMGQVPTVTQMRTDRWEGEEKWWDKHVSSPVANSRLYHAITDKNEEGKSGLERATDIANTLESGKTDWVRRHAKRGKK